ncbi:MAG TPA: type II toxin-antitoxin system PemK/MazF family toxin, partial [Terriglobales bacterium]
SAQPTRRAVADTGRMAGLARYLPALSGSLAAPGKKRLVLVLTRDGAIGYLSTVTVAPITTTIRGVPSEVALNEDDGSPRER